MKPTLITGQSVRTHLGETGTITGHHLIHDDWYHVRIDGAYDKQTPPRWMGELTEVYRAEELTPIGP